MRLGARQGLRRGDGGGSGTAARNGSGGAAVQTTFPPERWEAIVAVLRGRVQHLKEHNTICNATAVRQREAKKLAAASDAMIVVGGRTSANTHKLFEACKALCPEQFW